MSNRRQRNRRERLTELGRRVLLEPLYFIGSLFEQLVSVFRAEPSSRSWSQRFKGLLSALISAPLTLVRMFADLIARPFRWSRTEPEGETRLQGTWRRVIFGLGYPFYLVAEWVRGIRVHHDRRTIVMGLPALILGLAAVGLIVYSSVIPKGRLVRRYEQEALESLRAGDLDTATTYYQKLCGLRPGVDHYRYSLGLIAERELDLPRAIGIMTQLAPLDEQGYGRAHLWIARHLIARLEQPEVEAAIERPQLVAAIYRHLDYAIKDDASLWQAKELQSQLLLRAEPSRAEALLQQVVEFKPDASLLLARLQRQNGNAQAARQTLESYLPVLADQLETADLSAIERVSLIDKAITVLIQLERFTEAENFVGLHIESLDSPTTRRLHSKIHYSWALSELNVAPQDRDLSRVVEHLESSLRFHSGNLAALQLLADLLHSNVGDQTQIVDLLLDSIVDNRATATTYVVLGNHYSRIGQLDRARKYFDDATRRTDDPRLLGSVYNNIAWLYLHQDPPAPQQALEWIEQAFAVGAPTPEYHDTRGQVLALMGEWSAARDDLLVGLKDYQDLDDLTGTAEQANLIFRLHDSLEALVRCESELGNEESLRRYQQRLESIRQLVQQLKPGEPL